MGKREEVIGQGGCVGGGMEGGKWGEGQGHMGGPPTARVSHGAPLNKMRINLPRSEGTI